MASTDRDRHTTGGPGNDNTIAALEGKWDRV